MNQDQEEKQLLFTAFWRPDDPNGYLGQWYSSNFILTDQIVKELPEKIKSLKLYKEKIEVINMLATDRTYNTAEKFMMMGKAALFNDKNMFEKMYVVQSPKMQKSMGRLVKNFDENVWDTYCKDIVILGNYLKFSQNIQLKNNLMNTNKNVLIEGSPLDYIWGVGMRYDNPNIQFKNKWKGKNYLGECLEYVRNNCL